MHKAERIAAFAHVTKLRIVLISVHVKATFTYACTTQMVRTRPSALFRNLTHVNYRGKPSFTAYSLCLEISPFHRIAISDDNLSI